MLRVQIIKIVNKKIGIVPRMPSLQSIFSVALVMSCLILNNSSTSNVLITGFLMICAFISIKRDSVAREWVSRYLLIFSFLVSGIIGITIDVGFENIFRYLFLFTLIVSFPFDFDLNHKYVYYILLLSGVYLVIIQLGGAFGIAQIDSYLIRFYPIRDNLWSEEANAVSSIKEYVETGAFSRFGGVFYNPNIMGQMTVFWYVIMRSFPDKIQKFAIAVFFIAFVSILFSGSRTAFVVFLCYNIILNWNRFRRVSISLLVVLIGSFLLLVLNFGDLGGLRIFDISQGVISTEGSGSVKYQIFTRWLEEQTIPNNFNWLKFLFGSLSWDVDFDNDPGYILNFFGFLGAFSLLYFLFEIYKQSTILGKLNFGLLLIGIGATVIMNFRFSILLFMILSIGCNRSPSVREQRIV